MPARGFTLLEVMIAVAIISITLVTLLSSQSQSVSVAGDARFLTTASLLAQQQLSHLERRKFADINTESGDCGESYPGYTWSTVVRELSEDETGLLGTSGILKFVDLSIQFGSDSRYIYSLEYIAKK